MAYCLRSFVDTLDQVLNPHKYYKIWVLDHNHRPLIQSLFENATFLQHFLDNSSPLIQETISSLEDQIMDAAQKAADTLEIIITDQILLNLEHQSFTIFPPDLGEVIRVFEDAKQELSEIRDASKPSDHIMSPPVSSTRYPVSKNTVVGVEEDLNQLRSRLTSGAPELDIIPIVGMGGIGKTTLARVLYDEFSSKSHFDRCAWVTVSQSYDPQQILKTLLDCVTKAESPQRHTSDLKTTLYQTLLGRRYLIVLDDIWSFKAWDDVQMAFARDYQGSRIIFTTRNNSMVEYVKSNGHEMHLINDDKSWELLRRKVFGEESCPRELEAVGKSIALKCGGLPLALQVISGLLAQSERSKDFWEYVVHNVSSLVAKTDDQFDGIFSLSFAHLPHYLKPCFLYMGVFPEDDEILESRLIQLWIAEGFLYSVPNKSLEEAAEMHLNALVERNLIFVRTRKWNGKAKSYGIHDLLRELCLRKAQEKKFLYVVDSKTGILQKDILGHGVSIHIPEIGRVSIHIPRVGTENDYGSLKLGSLTRSIIVNGDVFESNGFVSRLCGTSLLLRVLHVPYAMLNDFQEMVLRLVNLRYLSTSRDFHGYTKARGYSVLENLQTVKVDRLESFAILEHMPQLRHLQFRDLEDRKSTDSFEISHENLQYLSTVPLHHLTDVLEKLPNLRTLKVFIFYEDSDVVDLTCFQKLEILSIGGYFLRKAVLIFPQSIKKLKLFCFEISQTLLHAIAILPGLQFLKFDKCPFDDDTWEPSEGEFCQLQYLEIYNSNLENWLATDLHFPQLQQLVIRYCRYLNEIPNDFGEIENLESIDVDLCKDSVFDSARTILGKQLEFGNTLFQLRLGKSIEDMEDENTARQLDQFKRDVEDDRLTIVSKHYFATKTVFPHFLRYLKLEKCSVSQPVLSAAGVLVDLQVLILEKCDFMGSSTWEASEGQFCQLRHLEITGAKNLVKWFATEIHFPILRYLGIQECHDLSEIPIGIGKIASLVMIEVDKCKPCILESATKILKEQRKLGNTLFQLRLGKSIEDEDAAHQLDQFKRDVEDDRLTIVSKHYFATKTVFPHFLRYLKLEKCEVSQTVLSAAGILVELQTFILENCYFEDSTWEPSEGQFTQLHQLEIEGARGLSVWLATEIHFPVLKHLFLQNCNDLNEIPTGIGRIETLELIEFKACKPSLDNSAWRILKEQRKLGNTLLQLRLNGVLTEVYVAEPIEKDSNMEVKWALLGLGEGLKGLETSSFHLLQDYFLTSESVGLDSGRSYSLDINQGSFAHITSAGGQRMGDSNAAAGTMASRHKRRKLWKETSLKPFNNSLTQFRLDDDDEEVKWTFPGMGEGSKGSETQVSSSPFHPSQDSVLTPESLELGLQGSYSLDSGQGIFANSTSDEGQRRQNVRLFPNCNETFDESAGTIIQRKATSQKFNPFYIAAALAALPP